MTNSNHPISPDPIRLNRSFPISSLHPISHGTAYETRNAWSTESRWTTTSTAQTSIARTTDEKHSTNRECYSWSPSTERRSFSWQTKCSSNQIVSSSKSITTDQLIWSYSNTRVPINSSNEPDQSRRDATSVVQPCECAWNNQTESDRITATTAAAAAEHRGPHERVKWASRHVRPARKHHQQLVDLRACPGSQSSHLRGSLKCWPDHIPWWQANCH